MPPATLSHRPNLGHAVRHRGSASWHVIGEIVGMSSSTRAVVLLRAYVHSPGHRANIEGDDRYLGIRTARRHGISWNTLDFVDRYSTHDSRTRMRC